MPMHTNLDPSAFFLDGGPTGVLLIHGFTGAPTEMRLLGDYLNDRGYMISAPLLPGHGTNADDLNNYCWDDWYDHANRALSELQARCDAVHVAGLSMGALLTLSLAASHSNILAIITYAAAVDVNDFRQHLPKFMARIKPQAPKTNEYWADPNAKSLNWSYETFPSSAAFDLLKQLPRIKEQLPDIACPLLAVYSSNDPTVKSAGVRLVYDQVSSVDKELFEIHDSGHVITLDKSWEEVAEKSYQFLIQHQAETHQPV